MSRLLRQFSHPLCKANLPGQHVKGTTIMPLTSDEKDGLLTNALDSMRHAYDHFWELARTQEVRERANDTLRHHYKWVILSAHHAAECLLQRLLSDVEPANESLNQFYQNQRTTSP